MPKVQRKGHALNNRVKILMIDGKGNDPHAIKILRAVGGALCSDPVFNKWPLLITPERADLPENEYDLGLDLYTLPGPLTYADYNEFVFHKLADVFLDDAATHVLLCQGDGFPINPDQWNDEWLQYDYIGAPWPKHLVTGKDLSTGAYRVGNGGFSLRSRKLMRACLGLAWPAGLDWPDPPEDVVICQYYRDELEDAGIKFAPPEVSAYFSVEGRTEWTPPISQVFGFHAFDFNRTRDSMLWRLGK